MGKACNGRFDHNVGNNLINASLSLNVGKIDLKVEADLVSVDSTTAVNDNAKVISITGKANLGKIKLPAVLKSPMIMPPASTPG